MAVGISSPIIKARLPYHCYDISRLFRALGEGEAIANAIQLTHPVTHNDVKHTLFYIDNSPLDLLLDLLTRVANNVLKSTS